MQIGQNVFIENTKILNKTGNEKLRFWLAQKLKPAAIYHNQTLRPLQPSLSVANIFAVHHDLPSLGKMTGFERRHDEKFEIQQYPNNG